MKFTNSKDVVPRASVSVSFRLDPETTAFALAERAVMTVVGAARTPVLSEAQTIHNAVRWLDELGPRTAHREVSTHLWLHGEPGNWPDAAALTENLLPKARVAVARLWGI